MPWWRYNGFNEIAEKMKQEKLPILMALGEQEYRMEDGFKVMIDGEQVDIVQPDCCMSGGFVNLLQVAQWSLDQQGSKKSVVIPHSPDTDDFTIIYTLHFMALKHGPFPNIGWWMEFGCNHGIPTNDSDFVFTPKLHINDNGTITINDDIGWGYTLKPGNIQKFVHAQI